MDKTTALIGYTGFVGGNLLKQSNYDDLYNSKNIEEIQNKSYDFVVSAGAGAVKWQINLKPENDWKSISKLMDNLKNADIKKLVLISTVDVYPAPIIKVNEKTVLKDSIQPYGNHRKKLEEFCAKNFDCLIIRLPGLFGEGLKKNIIYDLLNNHELSSINPEGKFQFYYLNHLTDDINTALNNDLKILNMATEPISVREIAKVILGRDFHNYSPDNKAVNYDMRSIFDYMFSGDNGYLYNKSQVLNDLKKFLKVAK